MAHSQEVVHHGGIGFLGMLTILFIALKLTGYITWSWWWVLAPMWIPVVLAIIILIICFIAGATLSKWLD